jgi:ABC-2 type transport system permease protein
MREILILLKYGVFLKYRKRRGRISGVWGYLIGFLILSFVTASLIKSFVGKLSGVNIGEIDLFELFGLNWSSFMNIMILMGSVGTGIMFLSMNEETEFLLSLPMRRQSITLYLLLSSMLVQLPFAGIYLAVLLSYSLAKLGDPLPGILSFVLNFSLITALGMVLSTFVASKFTRSSARKLFITLQILEIVPFLLLTNINSQSMEEVLRKLLRLYNFLSSPFNILGHGVSMIERPWYSLIDFGLFLLLSFIFLKLSSGIAFEVEKGKTPKRKGISSATVLSTFGLSRRERALLYKDLRAFFSNEMALFYVIYPYAFGAFMGFMSSAKNQITPVLVALMISTIYAFNEAVIASLSDLIYRDLSRSLPVDYKKLIFSKAKIPIFLNLSLMALMIVTFSLIKGFVFTNVLLLGLSALYYSMAAFMGIKSSMKNPPESEGISSIHKSISVVDVLIINGLAVASLIGVNLIFSGNKMGYTLLIPTLIIAALLIALSVKKINEKISEIL